MEENEGKGTREYIKTDIGDMEINRRVRERQQPPGSNRRERTRDSENPCAQSHSRLPFQGREPPQLLMAAGA